MGRRSLALQGTLVACRSRNRPRGTTKLRLSSGPAAEGIGAARRLSGCTRIRPMSEIIFVVEETLGGGGAARAVGESIFTQAATMAELHGQARNAVRCHVDEAALPERIRLRLAANP